MQGDTLVETLAALLIAALATTALATMVMASVSVATRSQQALDGVYTAESNIVLDQNVFRPAVTISIAGKMNTAIKCDLYSAQDGDTVIFRRYESQ